MFIVILYKYIIKPNKYYIFPSYITQYNPDYFQKNIKKMYTKLSFLEYNIYRRKKYIYQNSFLESSTMKKKYFVDTKLEQAITEDLLKGIAQYKLGEKYNLPPIYISRIWNKLKEKDGGIEKFVDYEE